MSDKNGVATAVLPPSAPTLPPVNFEKPRPASQDSVLKKKKKLLNGANIKFSFPSGATYEGSFKDGKIEGYGVYTYAQTGDVYDGEWKADLKHGHGSYKFANGDRYIGQWYMDNKHGKGQFAFASGDEYVGSWRDNQMNGYGVFQIVENGDRYEGYWKGGLRQGRGALRHGNGDVYDGEWDSGQQQGLGVFYQSNGDLYCGEWKYGFMDGRGVLREKGITFLAEYVGGYLISKLKLTDATDELEQGWSVVYNHFLKWLEERETVKTPECSPAGIEKMKDELDAAHTENSILRKRLEAAMELLRAKMRDGDGGNEGSSNASLSSKEAAAAAYWHECQQKAEAKVKLMECTLAERVVEIRKLTELVNISEAKIKEFEIEKAARKNKSRANKLANSYAGVKQDPSSLDATEAPAEEEEEEADVEGDELKAQNTLLLQLNDDLQRKNAFLSAENTKLALKREAAEEQYEKLFEELSELRSKSTSAALQADALLRPEDVEKLAQLPSYDLTSPSAQPAVSAGSLGADELQKRLIQANSLNVELRLKNGELQRKAGSKSEKEGGVLLEAAAQRLTEENKSLRGTIEQLKKQVSSLQHTSDDAEQRLYAATQREADLQAAMTVMTKEKSADPQLQRVLEGKSDQIAKLQLENAELARILEETQSRLTQKDAPTPREKRQTCTHSTDHDDEYADAATLQKKVKRLQKLVKKLTVERDATAEQLYDSRVHLARTHRVLGATQGQLIVFASLSDVETVASSKVDSVVRIDDTDPSRVVLNDCGEEVSYKLDYCFGKEATVPQIFSELRDALSFVWSGFQFGLLTVGELRSGKTTLTTQLFPLLVQNLLRATEKGPHAAYFSYTYRLAVVEISARGGYDCASETAIGEACCDSNGYVHPKGVRFIDCTSVSISTIVENLLGKRRQHYNGRSHTWIQLQCVRTGLAQQSKTVGRLTLFDWCGPGPLSSQKTDIESARFANASSQALRDVSTSLSAKSAQVPYTKSLETSLLFDLLGGNSITAVIGRIRPTPEHVEESIRTLGVLSSLFEARNGPLLQDNQTRDEIRWRGLVGALNSDYQAERDLKTVENTREF